MIGRAIIKLIGIGTTLETAEFVFAWCNRLLLLSLLLGVIATYGIVLSSYVKEDTLKLEIAKAGKEAEDAKAKLHREINPKANWLGDGDLRKTLPNKVVFILIGEKPGFLQLLDKLGEKYRADHPDEP